MARPSVDRVRMHLEIQLSVRERIEELMVKIEADSMTEVIKRATTLLQAMVDAREQGWEILLKRGDEERIVVIT
jgi:hypothetical protein